MGLQKAPQAQSAALTRKTFAAVKLPVKFNASAPPSTTQTTGLSVVVIRRALKAQRATSAPFNHVGLL